MRSFLQRLWLVTALLCFGTFRLAAVCKFDIKQTSLPDGVVSTAYSSPLSLTDTSGPPYRWTTTTLPDGLKLTVDPRDSSSAVLEGTPTKEGNYRFDISVDDAGGCNVTRTYTITINPKASCTMAPAALGDGSVKIAYDATLAVSPASPPYQWAVTSGLLPAGLTLKSDGTERATITGTPDADGRFSFTITARDSRGCTASNTYTIQICPLLSIGPASIPDGTSNSPYDIAFLVSGSIKPYTWQKSGNIPPGLTFGTDGSEKATLTGTPTTPGSYTFTLDVRDANGCATSRTYTLKVVCPTLTIAPAALADAILKADYNASLTVTGSAAPYSWSISAGALPTGMALTSDTSSRAVISGAPAAEGLFNFTVRVADANGCAATRAYSLRVACPTQTFSPAALGDGSVKVAYSAPVSVTPTSKPYAWTVSAGLLPDGLKLTTDATERAIIEGTPTREGSFTFTLKVADGNGCTSSRDYTVRIAAAQCPTLSLAPTTLPSATLKTAYSESVVVSGSAVPYAWSVSTGALPDGLKLTSDTGAKAVVEGTPTVEGSFSFTIKVSDAAGCSTSNAYTIRVSQPSCPTLTLAPATLPSGTTKTLYSESLAVTGSAAPYTWSVAAGALPAGLKLTSDTSAKAVIEGTPTTEGSFSFTIKVADAAGCSTSISYTVRISAPSCPTLGLSPASLPSGTAKALYSETLLVSGSATPYSWSLSAGALPPGLKLTSDTGAKAVVEGTPTTEGSFSFTVKVADANGCSTSLAYTIRIASAGCPILTISPATLSDGAVKAAYSAPLSVTSSQGPYAWSVSAGTLPPGLKLSADISERALIEGTPTTEGSYSFTIKVADGAGCATSRDFTIRVAPAGCPTLTISPSQLGSGTVNTAYSAKVAVTATKAPFTWSVSAGTLPAGLNLKSDGSETAAISGTPTTQGFFTFTVKVVDGAGCTTALDYTITISGRCSINPAPTTLVAPRDRSTVTSPVLLQWNKVDGAIKYQLFASTGGKAFEMLGETDGTSIERIVSPGPTDWYVVTNFADCPSQQSSTFHFTINETVKCGDGSVTILTPRSGEAVNSPATLSWSAVAGTGTYRIWLAINGDAPAALAKTADTSVSLTLPSGKIEWYVEAIPVATTCPSIISPRSTFVVNAATSCDNNAPATIESPAPSSGGAPAEATSPVDLRWRGSEKARSYRVWIALSGQPFQDIGFVTDIHLARELKPGSYEWYVDTYYESCPPVSSQHGFFVIKATAPRCTGASATILTPANNNTVNTSPVVFSWTAVTGAIGYRLFASIDGTEYALLGTTDGATSISIPMRPGSITWYVETVFDGCTSTVSAKSSFTVARATNCDPNAKVRLVSPPDNATNVPALMTFDWDAVPGATRYFVYAKVADGSFLSIGATEDTSLQKYAPTGANEWYVLALRDGCDPVESSHFHFTVASPDVCTNKRPVLLAPGEGESNLLSPVTLSWAGVQDASKYTVFAEIDGGGIGPIATTQTTKADVALPSGKIRWFVEASFAGCPPTVSADGTFTVVKPAPKCTTPEAPSISVPGQVVADTTYTVRWSSVANAGGFELQEATKLNFSDATTKLIDGLSYAVTHTATDAPVQYLYRVRAVSACSDDRGPYSNVIGIFIIPPAAKSNASAEVGTPTNVVQTIFLPGSETPVPFTARSDQNWVKITPSSGIVPQAGLTLTITADPDTLSPGTNTGTVIVEYAESGKNGKALGSRTTSSSVSVSLVTPVSSKGKNTPLPESLIIPAVAHTAGANGSLFESDIRIANTSPQPMKYQVFFTPSGTDGTQASASTTIQVGPGDTMALDDVLASFFGNGNNGQGASGMMEIRPLSTSSTTGAAAPSGRGRTTVASSRTYNVTEKGTFGQFIPAVSYSQFIGKSESAAKTTLSLQQISQSSKYRTNFGLVEASGEPVTVMFSVFDGSNKKIAEFPLGLQASEHRQFNGLLAERGITLEDGRVEVEVTSATGRVTAYASVVDNRTNDPMLVSPVLRNAPAKSNRVILPSIGDFDIGFAHWKSDVRVFNAGTAATEVTLSYYPQGAAASPSSIKATLQPGEVRAFDDFIATNFGKKTTAGSLIITTANPANIVATAKTYTDTANGTFGQFIPGVTPEQSISSSSEALQILQLEQSSRFRTNIGVAETSGKPAVAEISVVVPGSKSVTKLQVPLAANEFRQLSLIDFNVGTVYNARATVKVMSGTGTVTAYGSLIDQVTQDPTYVPAQ